MTFSVIETGGKQYKIALGDLITVEKISDDLKEGDSVQFDRVLLTDDGSDTKLGSPYIDGSKATGTIESIGRNKKIDVIRYRAKSRYFKKRGHKQEHMKVRITGLS